jgi:hypothetical protein
MTWATLPRCIGCALTRLRCWPSRREACGWCLSREMQHEPGRLVHGSDQPDWLARVELPPIILVLAG